MVALEEVSLEIPTGSVFGIIGRSGAGKSTLIRCLNLLERPTSGRIQVDGHELTTLSDRQLRLQRQNIGMIFQNFHLLHSRNVWDNIAVGLEIIGMPKAQRQTRVAALLDLVGLGDKAHAFPRSYPGAKSNGLVLPGRWRLSRPICYLMKPPVRWILKLPLRYWRCSVILIASWG